MKYTCQRVDALHKIIKDATLEIAVIKMDCKHDNGYYLGDFGDVRYVSLSRLCNDCDGFIANASKQEINDNPHLVN